MTDLWKQKKEGPPRWEGGPSLSLWKCSDYSRTNHHPQWYYRTSPSTFANSSAFLSAPWFYLHYLITFFPIFLVFISTSCVHSFANVMTVPPSERVFPLHLCLYMYPACVHVHPVHFFSFFCPCLSVLCPYCQCYLIMCVTLIWLCMYFHWPYAIYLYSVLGYIERCF